MMKLNGKVTLITGASAGIGSSIAEVFAEAGSNLILTARRKDLIDKLATKLSTQYGVDIHTSQNDVRNLEQVREMLSNLPDRFNNIDILVNNAGLARGLSTIQDGDINDWEEMIDTNIKGLLYMSRMILPQMVERGNGMVINISSIAGRAAYPKGNVYCGTKSAVKAISESMVIDLNGTGVRVCNIDPGMVETEFSLVRFHGDKDKADAVYKQFKALEGRDVAEIALFAATRPQHVAIQDIMVTPTAQANAMIVDKR
ncbi:MAG: SDR family NAD(P)-dependent oxidoreductase [Candidatus Kapabacteria bacterium]|nr:SDR family NAD(P)-dependent oxidoreductase [Ignavibacteriota bacterium]MCW5883918.1 SDR family NAD(P)-dependent oxidoreductase [Candidatus Kapabacteria bacterium]